MNNRERFSSRVDSYLMTELQNVFDKNNQEGIVEFDYETEIF